MNKLLLRAILPLLLAGVLTSCEVEEVSLVELTKVEVNRIDKQEMYLDVSAILDNPNSFNINIKDSDFDLYLENRYMGKANLENYFVLEKNTQKEYEMEIKAIGEKLNTEMLPIMLSAALTGKVNVRLNGSISGKVFLFSRKVDVDIEEQVVFKSDDR
jgi:LEA14-like dessication related protein